MRKFIVTILALSAMLSALVVAAQERPEDIWPKANDAYSLGEWKSALELYESIGPKDGRFIRLRRNSKRN